MAMLCSVREAGFRWPSAEPVRSGGSLWPLAVAVLLTVTATALAQGPRFGGCREGEGLTRG
jgi:hypothetical protein